jgi:glycosyltransferase involved in cell wall biosynthesis
MSGPEGQPTVAVIVPMYNAAATIDATIASICAQSYRALDIVIVDDGCTDRSPAIVEGWMGRDPRIRLVRTANGGVAAARNFGAASTEAGFLAFVDADDVWAEGKVAMQMDALRAASGAALVYCWFAQLDRDGRVFPVSAHPVFEGDVLRQLCRSNFVGNGSSMLMPREIFEHVGGFDPSMRARGAQGCEDLMFLLGAAEAYPFRVVPKYLVGYRLTPQNMSSDTRRMLRSFDSIRQLYRVKRPDLIPELEAHRADMILWLVRRSLIAGKIAAAIQLFLRVLAARPALALRTLPDLLKTFARARLVPRALKRTMARMTKRAPRPRYEELSW